MLLSALARNIGKTYIRLNNDLFLETVKYQTDESILNYEVSFRPQAIIKPTYQIQIEHPENMVSSLSSFFPIKLVTWLYKILRV